jgi:hypothetical protein
MCPQGDLKVDLAGTSL